MEQPCLKPFSPPSIYRYNKCHFLAMDTMDMLAALMKAHLSTSNEQRCSNPHCVTRQSPLKACAACQIVSYCGKECQTVDWKRHKALCLCCRPYKEYSSHLQPTLKIAVDEYYMLKLPPIDVEYGRKFRGDVAFLHLTWIKGGLDATRRMLQENLLDMNGEDTDVRDLAKRWQEVSPNLGSFVETAKPGDIFLKKQYCPYNAGAPQQFRNTPMAEPGILENGKTIVDIGFVDFGMAFDSIDSLRLDGEPTVVVGYEAEAQCVAKSMIMIEMMRDVGVTARSVVEVWLSSLWSEITFQAFKRATRRLLEQKDTMNVEVRPIIEFWSTIPKLDKKTVLGLQMKAMIEEGDTRFAMQCCALESESDRVTYLRYHLTKALYEDETTTVGSIVMGQSNEAIGVKQLYASCMEAVPTYIHQKCSGNFHADTSFMGRTIKYFEEKMSTYTSHIRGGSLLFTPKLGVVSLQNKALMEEIRALRPYTIHWSNVVDYLKPKEFHSIAKQVSGPETIHSLHSCNWTTRVFGTDVHDLNSVVRIHFYAAGLHSMKLFQSSMEGICEYAPLHYRSICALVLGRKYVHKFFRYFFEGQQVNCACFNGTTPLKQVQPFSRNVDTAFVTFAYKTSGITFGIDTYDFEKEEEEDG